MDAAGDKRDPVDSLGDKTDPVDFSSDVASVAKLLRMTPDALKAEMALHAAMTCRPEAAISLVRSVVAMSDGHCHLCANSQRGITFLGLK